MRDMYISAEELGENVDGSYRRHEARDFRVTPLEHAQQHVMPVRAPPPLAPSCHAGSPGGRACMHALVEAMLQRACLHPSNCGEQRYMCITPGSLSIEVYAHVSAKLAVQSVGHTTLALGHVCRAPSSTSPRRCCAARARWRSRSWSRSPSCANSCVPPSLRPPRSARVRPGSPLPRALPLVFQAACPGQRKNHHRVKGSSACTALPFLCVSMLTHPD